MNLKDLLKKWKLPKMNFDLVFKNAEGKILKISGLKPIEKESLEGTKMTIRSEDL